MGPLSAYAQQAQRESRSGVNLPSWAAPRSSRSASSAEARSERRARFGRWERRGDGPVTNDAPPPPPTPGAPADVPLGGVEWIAMAGVGYALARLRRREEEEEDALSREPAS